MAHRPKPRYASKDPHRGPWCSCDRCGFVWSGVSMAFQYDFVGGPVPVNLGVEVCPKCYDNAAYQQKQLILPPDPEPFKNTRPEPYNVDEAGPTQDLMAALRGSVGANFYLDLYDENPSQGGASVLSTLTGSATRTNYASVMTNPITGGFANATTITITDDAEDSATVAYVVIFDAATAGSIRMSAQLQIPQVVTTYNGAAFAAGALTITS